MKNSRFDWCQFIVASTVLFGLAGCSDSVKLADVSGTVTKNGTPIANAWVRFVPEAHDGEPGRPSFARTDKEGHFTMHYAHQDGVLIGRHHVTVGSGGETDDRGNLLKEPKDLLTQDVDVQSGSNTFDFKVNP